MARSKVSLTIDEDVLAEARERVGPGRLSAYATEAIARRLQHERDVAPRASRDAGPTA
jgi:hypothetical protein